MKVYCLDTAGLSTPHMQLPEDVPLFRPIWDCVIRTIESGKIGVTAEIYKEMCHLTGDVGDCIRASKDRLLMEVDDPTWDGAGYIAQFNRMRQAHAEWIADYTMKSPAKTISLKDLTAVALAKSLNLPLVSSESSARDSPKHKRIPDICALESVVPYSFNEFLRLEGGG
ncbi:MAG: DUF4411 family protein [Sphingomonas sp.]|nr:DUF4411 family protein [Sphingomonas sp.]